MSNIYNDLFGIPERKKQINSKRKGNDNEHNLARALTEWTGIKFGRVPSSGGLRWEGESRFIGDVVPQDETVNFPFTIETKSYKKLILQNGKFSKVILKFWAQCLEDCKRSGKLPMLIVRENGMPKDEWHIFFSPENIDIAFTNKVNLNTEVINSKIFRCITMKDLSKIPFKQFLYLIKFV